MLCRRNRSSTKAVAGDNTGRKKRSVAHTVTLEVTVNLEDYDFLANGTYDNDTGNAVITGRPVFHRRVRHCPLLFVTVRYCSLLFVTVPNSDELFGGRIIKVEIHCRANML